MDIILFSSVAELTAPCNVIIYGAGGRGYQILCLLKKFRADISIAGFVDTYKDGEFYGYKIYTPQQIKGILHNNESTVLIIASQAASQIYCSLMELGIQKAYIPNPLFVNIQKNPDVGIAELERLEMELTSIADIFKRPEDKEFLKMIPSFFSSLPDHEETLLKLFNLNLALDEQYFDFINKSEIRVAIDGGMENGSTTFRFLHHFPGVEVHAFEPFPAAVKLSPYYPFLAKTKKVHINFLGISNESRGGYLGINPACFAGNRMTDLAHSQYTHEVKTITIDDYAKAHPGLKIDFIKLDIEAFEIQAINGARSTIVNHRPQLAICIYHTMSDYYKIPKLLKSICENYNFYIGFYGPETFLETVLYGIPQEIDTNSL